MPRSILASCLLALLFTACRRADTPPATSPGPTVPVHTVKVTTEQQPLFIDVPATIRPASRAVIAARLSGTIASLPWNLGQSVHTGDILLTLATPEVEARVRQAQAQVAEASRATTREQSLVTQGVNPTDSLRDAEDRLRFAQAALAEAEAMLAYATVRAPFDGVITAKHLLPGDLATPGLPLLVLESTQHLRAEGNIPESLATSLHPGDPLTILVDEPPSSLAGHIAELSPASDAVSRSLLAKIALPAGTVRSGQFVRVQIPAGHAPALLVPASAVSLFGQIERLFVLEDNRAVLRLVKTGRTSGPHVEILAGLHPGEHVILAPPTTLRDGAPVSSQP